MTEEGRVDLPSVPLSLIDICCKKSTYFSHCKISVIRSSPKSILLEEDELDKNDGSVV